MRRLAAVLLLGLGPAASPPAAAQPADSLALRPPEAREHDAREPARRSAGGALRRSLLVPGWGQLYVGQWYKAPLAAGGVGFLAYTVVRQHRQYLLYRRAFRYVENEAEAPETPDAGNPFAADFESWDEAGRPAASTAVNARNVYRRNRDVSIFGTVFVYGLQALDAYVAGQLLDFDVGEDLSIRLTPMPTGLGLTARW